MNKTRNRAILIFVLICLLPVTQANPEDQSSKTWDIKIDYSGEWRALVESDNSDRRGYGPETITTYAASESATVRKLDDNSKELCVELWADGELVDSECTSSAYGEVAVGKGGGTGDPSVPFSDVSGFEFMTAILAMIASVIYLQKKRF